MGRAKKLYELLEASAEKDPHAIALIAGAETISYSTLSGLSNNICDQLKAIGIGAGDRVAIYTNKSITFVASIFGILKSGAAYIPVDFNAPAERNAFIIGNCEAKAIIVHKDYAVHFEQAYTAVSEISPGIFLLKNNSENTAKSGSDLAYILYTSGSTGTPKGVMYSHSGALEFINWSSDIFNPTSDDRFSSHAPFHFDLSVFDLFVAMKHGASLVLIDEETAKQPMLLAKLISEQNISIWYSTPTILNMLAAFGKMHKYTYDKLRLVLFAGEVFPVNQFVNLKNIWPQPAYYNLYGPTETNVCTYYKIPENVENISAFPIGKCCEHYNEKLVDVDENSAELLISGSGIMTGYWESEALNAQKLVTDHEQVIWYKTGDLVERNEAGELIYKGRIDRMIKRNGYRIELAEIEANLAKHPAIVECAVVASVNDEHATIITAFVACATKEDQSIIRMKEYCMKQMPVYMIPNNFIFLDALPQTASNKIDHQQLKKLL